MYFRRVVDVGGGAPRHRHRTQRAQQHRPHRGPVLRSFPGSRSSSFECLTPFCSFGRLSSPATVIETLWSLIYFIGRSGE
eukprot:3951070-Alexandrium_andersonii.AAC.1